MAACGERCKHNNTWVIDVNGNYICVGDLVRWCVEQPNSSPVTFKVVGMWSGGRLELSRISAESKYCPKTLYEDPDYLEVLPSILLLRSGGFSVRKARKIPIRYGSNSTRAPTRSHQRQIR